MGIRRFHKGFAFYLSVVLVSIRVRVRVRGVRVLQLLLFTAVLRFDPAPSCASAFFIPSPYSYPRSHRAIDSTATTSTTGAKIQVVGAVGYFHFHLRLQMTSSSPKRLVRIQEAPDPCLQHISCMEDIHNKIESARCVQGQYRDSSILKRQWVNTGSCNDHNGNPPGLDEHENGNNGSSSESTSSRIDSKTNRSISESSISNLSSNSNSNSNSRTSSFKVLQFNALAEGLSSGPIPPPFERTSSNQGNKLKSIYGGFCDIPNPEISLNFSLRQWRLMEVLLLGGCDDDQDQGDDYDIIAMQEIDHHYGFFEPLLKIAGYAGVYAPKPNSPGVQSGWYSDGCSFFWKEGVFKLQKEVVKGSFEVGNQIYVIATMKHIASGTSILFAMTHLKAGKGHIMEKIRTQQCKQLLKHVDQVAQETAVELDLSPSQIPIILLGDFNSDIREENSCIKTIFSEEQNSKCQMKMRSAYKINPPPETFFTTWKTRGTSTAKRVIDYIFFSPDRGLSCTEVLDVPKNEDMEETLLPGFKYPSDHLAIGATLNILHS